MVEMLAEYIKERLWEMISIAPHKRDVDIKIVVEN
jgi:hypothetical protein